MTSVHDRIRLLNSSPSAASPKDGAQSAAQQSDSRPPAPATPELRAPWGVPAADSAASPAPTAAHDPAARAERALRPLRSDGAALAAAADLAAGAAGGPDSGTVASAPRSAATEAPHTAAPAPAATPSSARASPIASPARPRGYRPPFAGDTSQYRGRVRSMPPKQPQQHQQPRASEAVFSRHSAPLPRNAAAVSPPGNLALDANSMSLAAQQQAPDPLQARSMPVAATESALPSTVTDGTLPAPPSAYRGRQRSMAPGVRSFRAASDPAAMPAAPPVQTPSPMGPGPSALEAADPPAHAAAGGDASSPAEAAAPPDAAAPAEPVYSHLEDKSSASPAASATAPGAVQPAADTQAPAASPTAHSAALVRRSISGSVAGGRSLLGRGHTSVPLSPPPMQVQQIDKLTIQSVLQI